jgi:hypothetical protein
MNPPSRMHVQDLGVIAPTQAPRCRSHFDSVLWIIRITDAHDLSVLVWLMQPVTPGRALITLLLAGVWNQLLTDWTPAIQSAKSILRPTKPSRAVAPKLRFR